MPRLGNKKKMMQKDKRFVYGVGCAWFGSIWEAGLNSVLLPCCPHCKGLLCEVATEEKWWASAEKHEKETPYPDYVAMLKWIREEVKRRKTCFSKFDLAVEAYKARKA